MAKLDDLKKDLKECEEMEKIVDNEIAYLCRSDGEKKDTVKQTRIAVLTEMKGNLKKQINNLQRIILEQKYDREGFEAINDTNDTFEFDR